MSDLDFIFEAVLGQQRQAAKALAKAGARTAPKHTGIVEAPVAMASVGMDSLENCQLSLAGK